MNPFTRIVAIHSHRFDPLPYVLGGSLTITTPQSLFIESSGNWFAPFSIERALGVGYVFRDRPAGWHLAIPVQLGYRIANIEAYSDYVRDQRVDFVFVGARFMWTRLWETHGFEVGITLQAGLPVFRETTGPAWYDDPGPKPFWLDAGLFFGWTLAP